MQAYTDSKKLSSESRQEDIIKQTNRHVQQQQESSIPQHLKQTSKILKLIQQSKKKIETSERFRVVDQFKSVMDVQVMQTNFQAIKVRLHYAKFVMQIEIIYTEIQEKIFEGINSACGSFGEVKFIQFEGQTYAMKGIPIEYRQEQIYAEKAYKEYFLCCLADLLGIGPKVFSLFGYDIILTKNMVFFVMEECECVNSDSIQKVRQQLVQNLQLMHSANFIHIDIKPENVTYSTLLKKHIFLDFGLSKIIREPIGTKSKTMFTGTLSFCSEEMKKCYYFQTPKFVDLYQNDLYCLKKTIQVFRHWFRVVDLKTKWMEKQKEEIDGLVIFQQVIWVLRLKYFLEKSNLKEIVNIVQNRRNISGTIYMIIKNSQYYRFLQANKEIMEKLDGIKTKIFSLDYQATRVDNILSEFFGQNQRVVLAEKIIPISQIVQSNPQFFYRYLTKLELILKLFHFFQPFSKKVYANENIHELKKTIVTKIYQLKQDESKQPQFFSQKLRFTLVFFCNNLNLIKNIKILLALRFLFVAIEEFSYVAALEKEIVEFIDEPFLKMLKLIEFNLFVMVIFQNYDEERKQKWAQIIQNLSFDYNNALLAQTKNLLDMVMKKFNIANQPLESKISFGTLIKQIGEQCCTDQEKQSVYFIKYLFLEASQLSFTHFSEQAPRGLALKIYSRFFSSLVVQLTDIQIKESKLFLATQYELKREYQGLNSKNLMKKAIQNFIQRLKQREESVGKLIEKMLYFNYYDKRYLSFFIEKIRQDSSQISLSAVEINNRFYCINYCLEYINQNLQRGRGQQKMKKSQWSNFLIELETNFNRFIQNPFVKQKVNSSIELRVNAMIIQARIGFQNGRTAQQLKQHMESIMEILEPVLLQFRTLVRSFIVVFVYLEYYVRCPYAKHYSKNILIRIVSAYISQKHFHQFEKMGPTLLDFIKIENQLGKYEENLGLLMSMIEYCKEKGQPKASNQLYYSAVDVFRASLHPQILIQIYEKIRFTQRQLKCGMYAFLVFQIYLLIKNSQTKNNQLKQITRTTLALDKMPWICQMKTKPELLKLSKKLITYKSKRKAFICLRLQIRNTQDQNRLKSFANELRSKVQNFTRKNIEQVFDNLRQKITRLQKLKIKTKQAQLTLNQYYFSYKY